MWLTCFKYHTKLTVQPYIEEHSDSELRNANNKDHSLYRKEICPDEDVMITLLFLCKVNIKDYNSLFVRGNTEKSLENDVHCTHLNQKSAKKWMQNWWYKVTDKLACPIDLLGCFSWESALGVRKEEGMPLQNVEIMSYRGQRSSYVRMHHSLEKAKS